jgi:glucosyl-3-phosphoglycerate synthase
LMRACVVVPARNEEQLIGACMRALAAQDTDAEFAVILVLDRCTDATEYRARLSARHMDLRVLYADGGVGRARRAGMDLALTLLPPDGLIATTDADSEPAPDWLRRQLDAVADGARAIGGRITLGAHGLPPAALARRDRDAARRLARIPGTAEHHQFSGASLAVTAATYDLVGRLEPREALEDEGFERALARHGVPIERLSAVQVTTSARTRGRARRGLAVDLERAEWLATRGYDAAGYPLERVLAAKDRTISAVLPTRSVAGTLGTVLDTIAALDPLVDEVLVVDAASTDGTRAVAESRGVRVEDESALLPRFGPALGKGDAMWRGLASTTGEIVLFADTDTEDFTPAFILGLLGPLLTEPISFIKGHYSRPFKTGEETRPEGGGRVTELVARPYLNLHVPRLAGFRQPLAGEIAAERGLLESIPFPVGYGVEIAMLIDVLEAVGLQRMAQVDLGTRQNRHQPLADLSAMALSVLTAAERRIHGEQAVAAAAPGPLLVPVDGDFEVRGVLTDERPPAGSVCQSQNRSSGEAMDRDSLVDRRLGRAAGGRE